MVGSKSTDKLEILCTSIKEQFLSDQTLKDRILKLEIIWEEVKCGDEYMAVPDLKIEFKP